MSVQRLADLAGVGPATLAAIAFMSDAACVDEDPDIFFPPGTGGRRQAETFDAAFAICARCPVTRRCADYAIAERITDGVFGGLAGVHREELRVAGESPGVCASCHRPTRLDHVECNACEGTRK